MYVEVVITILSIVGMALYYSGDIEGVYKRIYEKLVLTFGQVENLSHINEETKANNLNQGIQRLIHITLGINSIKMVYAFWSITLVIPISIMILIGNSLPKSMILIIILLLALIPLILLTARLKNIRVRSSKEGKVLLVELLDNYKINYYNMQRAIEITAATLEEAPNSRKLLFNLSKGLNRVTGKDDIKEVLNDFKYAIGTSWAGVLSDNIFFALSSGIRVEAAMEDLIKTISLAEEIEERAKRENNEIGLILKYLVPVCYIFTIVGGVKFFNLSLSQIFRYQFHTATGIWWFSIAAILYILSLTANFFLTKTKLDL